jgi:hypothetical protein
MFLFDLIKVTTPRKGVAKKQPEKNSIAASLEMRGSSLYGDWGRNAGWRCAYPACKTRENRPGKAKPPPG